MIKHGDTAINKTVKNVLCLFIGLVILIQSNLTAAAVHKDYLQGDITSAIQDIISWTKSEYGENNVDLLSSDFAKSAGTSVADWLAIALGRIGTPQDCSVYLKFLNNNISKKYSQPEKLDEKKATEWHRISLTVLSLGGDPTNISSDISGNKINLISDGTYNRGKTESLGTQGINSYIWGLITLDSMRYMVPKNSIDSRKSIITEILKSQLNNGSFTFDGTNPDIDITAMALQALAPYYNSEETYSYQRKIDGKSLNFTVRSSVDHAVSWLSSMQHDDGDFSSKNIKNANSTAQIITALCSLGIDPVNDIRFIKNTNSVLDGLMKYKIDNSAFSYSENDIKPNLMSVKANAMSSCQALNALCSLYRFNCKLRSIYDFRAEIDSTIKKTITELDKQIELLPDNISKSDYQTVINLFDKYMSIPISERCYVYQYHRLSDAMKILKIKNTSQYLSEYMNQTENGNGAVTNISSFKSKSTWLIFNKSDYEQYINLPKNLTTKNYNTVVRLYDKLIKADNSYEYNFISDDLYNKKTAIESIQKEIESLNTEIAQKLYPLDKIKKKDYKLIEALIKRANRLSDYDKTKILAYQDLITAKTQPSNKLLILVLAAAIIIIVFVIVLICYKNKNKTTKNKKADNNDW